MDGTPTHPYSRARWHDPALGRFLQPEAIVPEPGKGQAFNRYAYAYNNPVRYNDPSGHCPLCIAAGALILKAIDYVWTAYDTWQAGRTLRDPEAPTEEKLTAALTLALSGLELLEPDDLLPAGLPLDDIARRGITHEFRAAVREGGLKAGVQYLRRTLGDMTPQVIRHMYNRGMFREVRSAREWKQILKGVRGEAGLDVHHLIEQSFARRRGWNPDDIPAVVLDRAYHQQEVTARLFSILPTGQSYDPQDIWDAYVEVYRSLGHEDWLEVIWPYFERLGVER